MTTEKPEGSEFKVVDKRRFTDDGDERKLDSGVETTTRNTQAASQEKNKEQKVSSSVDFSGFIISLATQALVMMGEVPNPETGIVTKNIEAARQTIDILAMLEEKTKNNLTADEAKLFEEVLHSIRMAFVAKVSGK